MMWTRVKPWLVAAGALLTTFFTIYILGKRSKENEQLQERVRGAGERANAEDEAARIADPAAELRARGWVRGVETDQDRSR